MRLNNFLKGKTCCVFGGAGSIGSALCRKLSKFSLKKLIIIDQDESGLFEVYEDIKSNCKADFVLCNIRERITLSEVFYHKPDIVFHAAALKHVVFCEKFPYECVKTNVYGTRNLAELSVEYQVDKFIFISSDKAVNPSSQMGRTKLEGERICLGSNGKTKFIVVRFGNVLHSRGSLLSIWKRQVELEKSLTITDTKMERYFMSIPEACDLILQASYLGKGGEKFIFDMGDPIKIIDLAKTFIRLSGKDLKTKIIGSSTGEKLSEDLMTNQEKKVAYKIGKLWVIKDEKRV